MLAIARERLARLRNVTLEHVATPELGDHLDGSFDKAYAQEPGATADLLRREERLEDAFAPRVVHARARVARVDGARSRH